MIVFDNLIFTKSFIEGTLLIANVLLILSSIAYGVLIVKKKQKEESEMFIYFLIASGLYFLSQLATVVTDIFFIDVGVLKGFLNLAFVAVLAFAFITKYENMNKKKKH